MTEPENRTEPKRRSWFRFHLSTAVVLSLVAAALVGVNLRATTSRSEQGMVAHLGWPFQANLSIADTSASDWEAATAVKQTLITAIGVWDSQPMLLNVLSGMFLLILVACVIEYVLRRSRLAQGKQARGGGG